MFNWVHGNKRLMQIVLALVALPFALWGVNFYERGLGASNDIASVNGQKISEQEFTDALRQQQERMRGMLGRNFNPEIFDSPEMRRELLDGMVSQRLLAQFAVRRNVSVGDGQLRDVIASIPAFQEEGRFSRPRYEAMLRAEGYSPASFEASLRRDLMTQQLTGALSDAGLASKTAARQLARLRAQQREVAELSIAAEPQAAQAKISPEAVRAYYDANSTLFQVPEEVSVEYLVLDNDALAAQEKINPEDIKTYYDANIAKFGEPEQRRASHILISVKSGASDADKAKAREHATRILAQLRKSPGSFAELAKKNSDDPGSAQKGGDLGFFSRGMMVRPFEEVAFHLKPNELSDLVESDFGFHIIKITGIKPGKVKRLEEVRSEIEQELRKQRAGRRFAEAAEAFSNLVYEQADSLKPAAERFKLSIQKAGKITRQSASVPALNNPKLLAALFTDDALKNRRNTEAIETGRNMLVSARVMEHKPASLRPFDEVKNEIARQLAQREALTLARQRGAERLEQLKTGKTPAAGFGAPKLVSRDNPQSLAPEVLSRIFRTDVSKLPAYAGIDSANGYVIYRLSRVVDVEPDETRERSLQAELGRASGAQEFRSFLGGLRADGKVETNTALLEKKVQ